MKEGERDPTVYNCGGRISQPTCRRSPCSIHEWTFLASVWNLHSDMRERPKKVIFFFPSAGEFGHRHLDAPGVSLGETGDRGVLVLARWRRSLNW